MSALTGRRCLVTGASRGLGAAIARRFWAEGADLLLVARSADALNELCQSLEGRTSQHAYVLAADLADPRAPETIVEEARHRFGTLSVLVNNAGVQGPIGCAWESNWAEWQQSFRVNFLSVADLSRRALPLLDSGGKIISLSGGGAAAARPRFTAYAAAKTAVVRFSETLAEEVRSRSIDVNCVAPGALNSAMTDAILAAGPVNGGQREYDFARQVKTQGAEALEQALGLFVFLASVASDGISGKLISARWDRWESLAGKLKDLQTSDVYTLRRVMPADRGFTWGEK